MAVNSARAQEELQRDLLTHKSALAALTEHPSWLEFVEDVRAQRDKYEQRLLRRVKDMENPLSEREAGHLIGYLDALSWIAGIPRHAKNQLERQYAKEARSR